MSGHENEKKVRKADPAAIILVVAIIVVSILSVNCYIEKYEKTYDALKLENEYSDVCNEGKLLNIEYSKRADYKEIKEYVQKNFNMKKLETYQYEYINNSEGDKMLVKTSDEKDESFISGITKAFSVILEYFN